MKKKQKITIIMKIFPIKMINLFPNSVMQISVTTNNNESIHNNHQAHYPNIEPGSNCKSVVIEDNNKNSFHNDELVENKLLSLMFEIGAPNYAYKKIMKWAKDSYN